MSDTTPVIKLPFKSGEHLCTWEIPDDKGGVLPTPGLLTVEPGRWSSAVVYGELPIAWQESPSGVQAQFPQRHEFECLVGQLASGAHVALLHGELNYWVHSQGSAVGALAVLSRNRMTAAESPTFSSIEFQIEGLEALLDALPIASVTMPNGSDSDSPNTTWSVTLNPAATWSWSADGTEMTVDQQRAIHALDWYEFSVKSSPSISLKAPQGLTIKEWWERWVMPLRRLISVVTAAPRGVQYLVGCDGSPNRSSRAQVFGMDIAQSPQNSVQAEIRKLSSAIRLGTEVSLLDVLLRWRELEEHQHPLLETYGNIAITHDQHPRSRFLLLLQALEGLHGYETEADRERRQTEHTARRDSFLERVLPSLDQADAAFLKKFLMKRPHETLEAALISILDRLPWDVRPELESLALTRQVRMRDDSPNHLRVEAVLAKVRNLLAHGSAPFSPDHLVGAVQVLERVARSETVRILGAPEVCRERALRSDMSADR